MRIDLFYFGVQLLGADGAAQWEECASDVVALACRLESALLEPGTKERHALVSRGMAAAAYDGAVARFGA